MVVLLTTTNQGGASSGDYSGVPASVTFQSGDTEQSFTFTAAQDTVVDGGDDERGDGLHQPGPDGVGHG